MRKSKLSKTKQRLATEHIELVRVLAKYFCQSRPAWQRRNLLDDLEGEGMLALSKAARTYDPKRLPYPRAYFARAILNSMLKWIKRFHRVPGERISLNVAEEESPVFDQIDYLGLAIADLPEEDQGFAVDRFVQDASLRAISEVTGMPVRVASLRSQRLARHLSESLEIQLVPRNKDAPCRSRSSGPRPESEQASARGRARRRAR